MTLIRLLIILLLVWVAYSVYKRYLQNKQDKQEKQEKQEKRPLSKDNAPQKVIKCDKCATHIPEHEAIRHKGRYYCSEEHKRLDSNN